MFEDIPATAFSACCSLILSSTLLAAAPQSSTAAAATPRMISAAQSSPDAGVLSKAADYVFKDGRDINLSGKLCTPLGLTQNKQDFPVKQYVIDTGANKQTINVSRVRGRIDIIFFYRTENEGTLYLTSVDGDLESAIHATKTSVEILNLATAKADFEREKAWWVSQVASVAAK